MKVQLPVYFTANAPLQERDGLRAQVDRVVFTPSIDAPPERPFPFTYFVTVHNGTAGSVTIKARKWVITDATGRCHVVEGDGIVGRFPLLAPGESFSFNCFHAVAGDSRAEGALLASDDAGRPVLVRIPAFAMSVPQ